jgi:hypothetical protein
MDGISALTRIGLTFLATGNWSLVSLIGSISKFLLDAFSPPLIVHIVLLSQDSTFRIGEDDISDLIDGLFDKGDCEWICDSYGEGKRREGVARLAIPVRDLVYMPSIL